MLLKLLLRFILPPGAKQRLGQEIMRRPVKMIRVHRKTFLESGDGAIIVPLQHAGDAAAMQRRGVGEVERDRSIERGHRDVGLQEVVAQPEARQRMEHPLRRHH